MTDVRSQWTGNPQRRQLSDFGFGQRHEMTTKPTMH
jgi:hypothetical protein